MLRWNLLGICVLMAVNFAACRDDDDDDGGDGDGSKGGTSQTGGTSGTSGEGGAPTGGRGGTSSGGTSSGGASSGGTSGAAGDGAGMGGDSGAAGAGVGGEGGAPCVPTEPPDEVCDEVDNDCNGEVDDIDEAEDGIRDCLTILLIGGPGAQSSSNFRAWLEEQGTTVARIHDGSTVAALTPSDLNGFDIAILDSLLRDYTPAESEVLSAWVRAGGGLMSLNGHNGSVDLARGNSLLVELGVEHLAGLRSSNVTLFRTHPLTTSLTSVTFQGGYRLGNLPAGEGSTVVAELTDGPVGLALVRGSGRAFVWGDEWVEFDSQWQSLPEIKQFWVNALGWLSGTL